MNRMYCVRMAVAWLLWEPHIYAEPVIVGDIGFTDAASDAMSTTLARLDHGMMEFELTQSSSDGVLSIKGTYIWSPLGDRFCGVVREARPERTTVSGSVAPARDERKDIVWFRTKAEECQYISNRFSVSRRMPPPAHAQLPFRERPFLDAFYYGTDRHSLLEKGCQPHPNHSKFVVTKASAGQVVLDTEVGSNSSRYQKIIDPSQGMHVVSYRGESPGNWRKGRIQWSQHESGVWYPSEFEDLVFPHGSFDHEHLQYRVFFRATRFNADPAIDPKLFSFSALELPVGTRVNLSHPGGHRNYVVGGDTGKQAQFERQLRSAAEGIKSGGLASPGPQP